MTDLEITKLCAAAMGLAVVEQLGQWRFPNTQHEDSLYDPLHDKAQALELVERFRLMLQPLPSAWAVTEHKHPPVWSEDTDLLRAICECVAKLEAHRQGAK